MKVPPPPHTHTQTLDTQTLDTHVCLSAPGFGAHRICACADPDFHLFSSAYFTEGPICLGLLQVSFVLTENYSTCINRPVRGPRMMSKCLTLKVVVILVVRLYGIRAC